MSAEQRIRELELDLPPAPKPMGVYRPLIVVEHHAYLSGHGPIRADGSAICGRLGDRLSTTDGRIAARCAALLMLSTVREGLGSLDRVSRLVKTTGFVNSTTDFSDHPAVINGFSELMQEVFGDEQGTGARSAIGVAALPGGWAVEIEAVFALRSE